MKSLACIAVLAAWMVCGATAIAAEVVAAFELMMTSVLPSNRLAVPITRCKETS